MPKGRLDVSIDDDILAWIRLNKERGEISKDINDFLRMSMEQVNGNTQRSQLDGLLKEFEDLKNQNQHTLNKMGIIQSNINKIKREIDKEEDQMIKDLEAQADSLRMSGAWEEMTR